ncbi:lipid A-modifier LpxR family protein [Arenibacter sp. S6351L]|uniref:lipid A deacylase LpxR family protein n=1 Tax=Arenibacter sp. S6351L TaxID=2926407 RepID=UPI001FF4ECAC|nr:lipid A-modifier LpxR family protein [Arenibacter sp. S6351L]MCK0137132.1 lipid A deacylase LpxR family protein [Arenibacter sp. S6351L]
MGPSFSKGLYNSLTLFICFVGGTLISVAQQEMNNPDRGTLRNQIGLRHDNDFILLTDRYYTAGLFLTYRHRLEKGFFNSENEQLSFSLGQEIITPSYLITEDVQKLDRAYVGFSALRSGWSRVGHNNMIEANFLLGIAGEASGAGSLQRWYHHSVMKTETPTWVGEMENSVHYNLYTRYLYEWQLAPNPFSIHIAAQSQFAFGTRDIYMHPELVAYFGKRNPLSSSIAHNQIGSTDSEIFFALRGGYRMVGHNGLLEGNALGDDSVLLVASNKTVAYAGFDFQFRHGRNEYWVGVRYNTPEFEKARAHQYVILSYTRGF